MSSNSAVTYTSVHSEAQSWSIPSEDPYEKAAQQLLELEDRVPLHIPEHPEDLVPAKDEAPIEAYILKVASAPTPSLPPSFLSLRIRPLHTRAAMAQMRAAVPSTYHSLLPSRTPPLLPISLPVPSTSRRAEILEAKTPPRKRLLLTAPRPGCEVGESSAAAARQPGPTMARSAPCSPEYVPDPIKLEDHVPLHIPEHLEDLVPAKDEAPIEAYIIEVASAPPPPLPPSFLSLRIRPRHTKAAMAEMRAAVPSAYHSLLPSGTPPLAEIPEADTPPQKRLLLTAPRPGCEVGETSAAATAARQPGPTMARSVDRSFALAGSEAYSRTLEARVAVLETQARRHEWQRQTADDFDV
nr:hypothetical protein [Tanacetum cinerariifolium]